MNTFFSIASRQSEGSSFNATHNAAERGTNIITKSIVFFGDWT